MMGNISTFVYLFDTNDKSFEVYGNNNLFAEALSKVKFDTKQVVSVLIGDFLLTSISSDLTGAEKSGNLIASSYNFNKYLYASLLLDLSNTLSSKWYTFEKDDFFQKGIRSDNMLCITITNISNDIAIKLDDFLNSQSYYIGAGEVDNGNILHLKLFYNCLIPIYFLKDNSIFFEDGQEDIDWPVYFPTYSMVPLDSYDFNDDFPSITIPKELTESGKSTLNILKNKGNFGHHKKVGAAFLNALLQKDIERDFKLETFDFNDESIVIPEGKLAGYALNLEHEQGKSKAKFFKEVLAIEARDWKYLAEQIRLGLNDGEVCEIRVDQYGIKYHVDIIITGLNGIISTVRTAWIIRPNESMQLVTIHPEKKIDMDNINLEDRTNMAVPPDLEGDDRWSEIFRLADEAGKLAGEKCIPTPVLISGSSIIMEEGKLGKALISFFDSEHDFVQWLKENKKGFINEKSLTINIAHQTQSIERAVSICKRILYGT